jgi:hypothetical protein
MDPVPCRPLAVRPSPQAPGSPGWLTGWCRSAPGASLAALAVLASFAAIAVGLAAIYVEERGQ